MRGFLAFLLAALLVSVGLVAQTTNATASGSATVVSSPSITQNYAANDPGSGRWFVQPVQPYQAPVMTYLGPWNTGSNILEDLKLLPEIIDKQMAQRMYEGGVSSRINKMEDGSYQFRADDSEKKIPSCKLLHTLPLKPLLDQEGNEVLAPDGKSHLFVPDETKFKRMAFIFLQGNKKATTIDVVAQAVLKGIEVGANELLLVKKVTGQSISSTGFGFGLGYVSGKLSGNELNQSQATSGGTGFNHATAKPSYTEGMIVLALQELAPADPLPLSKP